MEQVNHHPAALDARRLSELYRGILVATGDARAAGNVQLSAAEGTLTLHVKWTQANEVRHHHAVMTPIEPGQDEDAAYTAFATRALEEVRAKSLEIDADPATPAVERSFAQRVREAAGDFTSMLASRRLQRLTGQAQQKENPDGN